MLVHGTGDYVGKPFRLEKFERAWLYSAYELLPDGSRAYDRVLIGVAKGNGKTEFASAVALLELAGPVIFDGWNPDGSPRGKLRLSPDIPVAAGSLTQSKTLPFDVMRTMVEQGPLANFLDVFDERIARRGEPGVIYPVSQSAARYDGLKHTFVLGDELHEWDHRLEKVYGVLSRGRAKRTDSWELLISTAGWDLKTLLGRLYEEGKARRDKRFLFIWYQGHAKAKLKNRNSRRAYLRKANPALGLWLHEETYMRKFDELIRQDKEHDFRRFFGNEWVSPPRRWITAAAWDRVAVKRKPPPKGSDVVLGFDGSLKRDWTALVGCTLETTPHLWVVATWSRPPDEPETWRVPVRNVERAIIASSRYWRVARVGCDPYLWQRSIQDLMETEGLPMEEWPTRSRSRMGPASLQFADAVHDGELTQDGDRDMREHVKNAVAIETRYGRIPTKDKPDSTRHIDLLVAAILALDLAIREGLGDQTPAPMMTRVA